MKHTLILCLLLFISPAWAQQEGAVKIDVLKMEKSQTANREADLVHFKLRLTNNHHKALPYTNNRLVLKDNKNKVHLVSRPWYPQGSLLNPGESVEFDRVYFEIPKKSKPAQLVLFWRRIPLGSVKL